MGDLLRVRHQQAHDIVADAGEVLHPGLGEVRRRDALEALLVGLLLGHVVAAALGGGVHEDEPPVVHGDIVDAVRAVCPALPQDLDAPVPQVCADCLVRPLVDALPVADCLLVLEPAPLARLVVRMAPTGKVVS